MAWRRLTDFEIGLLNYSPCARVAQQTQLMQNNATEMVKQYVCNGLTFFDVWRPQEKRRYVSVWNHPGQLTATGLAGSEIVDLGAYHPNPWRQLTPTEDLMMARFMCDTCLCGSALKKASSKTDSSGVVRTIFSCEGYTFMKQDVPRTVSHGPSYFQTYWFVYNNPAPLVFSRKVYEVTPRVPSRTPATIRGIPMSPHTTPHWPGVGVTPCDYTLGGDTDTLGAAYDALPNPQGRPEINAANDFLAYYSTNGCSRASLPVVKVLQVAYNASGLPGQLTEDGEYGPNTQRALQNVMDEAQADAGAGPSQGAPANCFPEYGSVPTIPALDVTPSTPATPSGTYVAPVTTVTGSTTSNNGVLLAGGAAALLAGGLGWWYYRRHKRAR